MRAELHPEYQQEQETLEQAFTAICKKRDGLDTESDRGADAWASAVLRGMVVREWNKLTAALDQPYFGRVDWIEKGGCPPETMYIGRQEFTEANIYSWAAPLVGELYNILVVQGVAGSGKTAIALHRLPYLLYNNHHRKDYDAANFLFLGPSNLFLNYISAVLPALWGVQIPQLPLAVWLLERLEKPVEYQSQEELLEYLLDQQTSDVERRKLHRREQLKGSLKMVTLLDRYTKYVERNVLYRMSNELSCVRKVPERAIGSKPDHILLWRYDGGYVKKIVTGYTDRPLAERITMAESFFIKRANRDIEEDIEAVARKQRPRRNTPPLEDVIQEVRNYFDQRRPQPAAEQYRQLLTSRSLLQELGSDLFARDEIELLHRGSTETITPLSLGDLAAIVYLRARLYDARLPRQCRHIVVDEAQDITPLQLSVLNQYAPKASYTFVGDTAQSVFPQEGLSGWSQIAAILKCTLPQSSAGDSTGERTLQVEQIRQSYRSTIEITEFCNNLLRHLGATKEELALPIARSGEAPQVRVFASDTERVKYVQALIAAETEKGYTSVALIGKSAANCRKFLALWNTNISAPLPLIADHRSSYSGGVVLLPAYLAKGIEFDVVIVVDADAGTYSSTPLDTRLLYVGLTRAAHVLYVCCTGTLTPLLGGEPILDNVGGNADKSQKDSPTARNLHANASQSVFATNGFYHIVQHGAARQHIAYGRPEQTAFIECLQKHFKRNPVQIIAYCLLPNRYHLLVRLQTDELDKLIMQPFVLDFIQRINSCRRKAGPVLEPNFSYHCLDNLTEVMLFTRAIHFSPVDANLVKQPEDWIFSSYRDYVGLRTGTLPTTKYVLNAFSSPRAYQDYVVNSSVADRQKMIEHLQNVRPFVAAEPT